MDTPLCDAVAKDYGVIFDKHSAMKVRELEEAARNLVRVKGRHHTEQALKRLAEACGMTATNVKVTRPAGGGSGVAQRSKSSPEG